MWLVFWLGRKIIVLIIQRCSCLVTGLLLPAQRNEQILQNTLNPNQTLAFRLNWSRLAENKYSYHFIIDQFNKFIFILFD